MSLRYWRHTDEVEKIDTVIMLEDLRKLLRYLYAEQLLGCLRVEVQSRCNGCIIDHPSQAQHICINPTSELLESSELYGLAESKIDKQYLKVLYIETCNTLWLNHRAIDFESCLQEFLEWWVATDFQDVDHSLNVEPSYVTAGMAAVMKISALENRLSKR